MLNYRHLHYFWVVTKEGGFARAAERLDMAVQTISAQVRELEKSLGHQLLKPAGRGVALTEAGQAAFARAEEIFQLGQALPDEVRAAASGKVARLAVGLSDGISKLAAHALLEPVLATSHLRLVCHEGEFEQLLGELALHHLDLVLAGQAAPRNPNLRLVSERLVDSLLRAAPALADVVTVAAWLVWGLGSVLILLMGAGLHLLLAWWRRSGRRGAASGAGPSPVAC